MSSEIVFANAVIKDSIVDSINNSATKDNTTPFSFLEFITNTGVDYTPELYNKFYLYYLERWSNYKNTINNNQAIDFINLYIDFLKEITLTFSTQQELKFLSTLDFNDPSDLDVALPFYVEKIRQIILFYKEKRDTAKFTIDRNKIKGTSLSVEKALFEKIYDYVFTSQDDPSFLALNYSLSTIQTHLKIDILEFVDVYSEYFDIVDKNIPFTGVNRESIQPELFFETPFTIFKNKIFLTEIPLAVNAAVSFNTICDPLNPLDLLINDCEERDGISIEQKAALKINYLKKYAGVDMYYINTTTTPATSGILFTADTPTNNIQNLQNIYTPTAESNQIKLLRDIGLFFKPDKGGIFQLNANNFTYDIKDELEGNKIYVFPDPGIYGNVSLNSSKDYPLVYIFDNRPDIKNSSSSFASGDPYIKGTDQTFSPYYTKEQTIRSADVEVDDFSFNFNDLYNLGYITKYQTDIYGNEYGLFKDDFGQSFKQIDEIERQPILNLLLNGHEFYDYEEGYNFNYSLTGRDGTTVRSGMSSLTVDIPSSPNFILSGFPYYLYFREFQPYQELNYFGNFIDTSFNNRTYNGAFRDGGGFTFPDGSLLPDPIVSSDPSYPGSDNNSYYYNLLVNAVSYKPNNGIIVTEPGLQDLLTESSFLLETEYGRVNSYNCGYFTDIVQLTNDYNYSNFYRYYDTVSIGATTVLSTLTGNNIYRLISYKNQLEGKIFVKSPEDSFSKPISSALGVIFNKYSSLVKSELYNSPKNIEIFYDNICIETDNYIVIDKIVYESGKFIAPSTKNTVFPIIKNDIIVAEPGLQALLSESSFILEPEIGRHDVSPFSNKFYNEKDNTLMFCTIQRVNSLNNINNKAFYPNITRYNLETGVSENIFPRNISDNNLTTSFNLSSLFTSTFNINIVNFEKPTLSYGAFNDVYKLTYVGVDNNNLFHLFDISFDIVNNAIRFLDAKFYKSAKICLTTNFASSATTFTNINSVSGSYNISQTTGILSI